jgi:hypothetical protein
MANPRPALYFRETDHWVLDEPYGFVTFWQDHGGLPIFGYPVTGAYEIEGGLIVQFFERARFEYHRSSGKVMLGRLGADYLELRSMHQAWFKKFQAKGCTV